MPIRQTVPGQVYQGVDEEKSYIVAVGQWFSAPTEASAVIWQGTTDRSASNFSSGAASTGATISTCYVTTPCLVSLQAGIDYRVEVRIQQGGEVLECYFYVAADT